jgi:hypothetical protein
MKLVKEKTMTTRWLSGVLTFALGFGCISLATNATAQEIPEDRGTLEDGLDYINTERDITLINTGEHAYLVMVQREPGATLVEVPVSYNGGLLKIIGLSLSKAIVYRLEPVAILETDFWRPCLGADCTWIGPLPPPPPPIVPPNLGAKFLNPL